MTYTIYKYTFPNGMIYVGVTKRTIKQRQAFGYQHNQRLVDAIRFYGWKQIKSEAVFITDDEATAYNAERQFIAEFDSTNPSIGYNISLGGKETYQGLKHTEEAKDKIRNANVGREFSEAHKKNLSNALKGLMVGEKNPMYGKRKSKETIEKQYKSHECQMKPVLQLSDDGCVINRYPSINAAARTLNTTKQNILTCLKKKSKTACGYKWAYDERG